MSIKCEKKRNMPVWLLPAVLAFPFAAGLLFAAVRWGGTLKNLIHVLIKMVVIA